MPSQRPTVLEACTTHLTVDYDISLTDRYHHPDTTKTTLHQQMGGSLELSSSVVAVPAAPASVTALAGLAALAGVIPSRVWRVGRVGITAVHEGGHAVAAVMSGHTVTAVHLRPDSSGVTYHRGRQRWTSRVVTASAGYTAPGLVAVAGAALVANHQTRVWLGILTGLAVLMVVGWVRNLFGIAVVGGLAVALGWLLASGTTRETVAVATFATWYLAIGGLRSAVEQFRAKGVGDGFELGRLLHLPAGLCRTGFVLMAAASLAACTLLLLHW